MRRLPLLLALCLAGPAAADKPPPLLARIDAAQRDLRTFSAEFEQKNRVRLFRHEVKQRGRVFYERGEKGGRLRWEYTEPDKSVLLLLGNTAHLQMPGQKARVFDLGTDGTMRAIFDELQLWLGSRALSTATDQYQITAGSDRLTMVPKAGSLLAKTFTRIEMRVDPRTLLLAGLLLVEQGGDEKEIIFSRARRNERLPDSAFAP